MARSHLGFWGPAFCLLSVNSYGRQQEPTSSQALTSYWLEGGPTFSIGACSVSVTWVSQLLVPVV